MHPAISAAGYAAMGQLCSYEYDASRAEIGETAHSRVRPRSPGVTCPPPAIWPRPSCLASVRPLCFIRADLPKWLRRQLSRVSPPSRLPLSIGSDYNLSFHRLPPVLYLYLWPRWIGAERQCQVQENGDSAKPARRLVQAGSSTFDDGIPYSAESTGKIPVRGSPFLLYRECCLCQHVCVP